MRERWEARIPEAMVEGYILGMWSLAAPPVAEPVTIHRCALCHEHVSENHKPCEAIAICNLMDFSAGSIFRTRGEEKKP